VTDESILLDPESPQGQAMAWLVYFDPAKVDPSTYSTFHQRYTLATLYFATDGDDWIFNARWMTEAQECSWLDICCNNDFAVTDIQLGTLKELASLLFSLFFFSQTKFSVDNSFVVGNSLNGTIPDEIHLLQDLLLLDLSQNYLEGSIPKAIVDLPSLEVFRSNTNSLSGPIPDNLGVLSTIREFSVRY
jgi:hypothetical protein